jgi:SAM-dependent methyltransferase
MALAYPHIALFWTLRNAGIVGDGISRSVLEFGEQNWFGDVDPAGLAGLIEQLAPNDCARDELGERLESLLAAPPGDQRLFDLAKLFYRIVLGEHSYRAIDLHGTQVAEQFDLNLPLPFPEQFDVVTNLGTAEHVFNQYQLFKSMHEKTRPAGLMIHSLPNQGCYDHGFYNYHPTFVFDLSAANHYQIVTLQYIDGTTSPQTLTQIAGRAAYVSLALDKKLSNYSGLLAVLRKPAEDAPFAVPQQGYYDNQLPPDLMEAWNRLPR